jgi:hypothetical protein
MCTAPAIPGEDAPKVTKFEPMPICIKVDVDANSAADPDPETHTWVKGMFFPLLDEFSQLSVPNSQPAPGNVIADQLLTNNGAVVYLESMGVSSTGRRWVNDDASVLVNEMYAIVSVYDGTVTEILWDPNPCAIGECAAELALCVDDQCGVRTSGLCDTDPAACSLRVHLTFVGTDKFTEPLKTANVRKSNWAAYSFAAASEGFLKAAKDFKDSQTAGSSPDTGEGSGGGEATSSPVPTGNTTTANGTTNSTDNTTARVRVIGGEVLPSAAHSSSTGRDGNGVAGSGVAGSGVAGSGSRARSAHTVPSLSGKSGAGASGDGDGASVGITIAADGTSSSGEGVAGQRAQGESWVTTMLDWLSPLPRGSHP